MCSSPDHVGEDVLLLTADGLRYDAVAGTRNDAPPTPTLDALADDGAACEQAIVTGTATRKSFPGILTSSYPLMYGGYAQLTDQRVPLASVFRSRGYATMGVNTNAQLHSRFGWDRGFDVYHDSERTVVNDAVGGFEPRDASDDGDEDAPDDGNETDGLGELFERVKSASYDRLDQDGLVYRALEAAYRRVGTREVPHPRADDAVDRTLAFLDRAPDDRPVFLWVHFMESHSPYVPPATYRAAVGLSDLSLGRIWRINDRLHADPDRLTDREVGIVSTLYDASLRFLDDELGRLVDGLGRRGRWEDSNVVFTSDHGEGFREHGGLTHCIEPYEEGAHVPLLVKLGTEPLRDVGGVVSTVDIGPTLLDATFENPDVPERYHGRSLCAHLRGNEEVEDDRVVFCQNTANESREIDLRRRITGCRSTEWKFITSRDEAVETKLFHLPSDADERRNLAGSSPETVERFEGEIERHYRQDAYEDHLIEGAIGTGDVDDRLRALGYRDT